MREGWLMQTASRELELRGPPVPQTLPAICSFSPGCSQCPSKAMLFQILQSSESLYGHYFPAKTDILHSST